MCGGVLSDFLTSVEGDSLSGVFLVFHFSNLSIGSGTLFKDVSLLSTQVILPFLPTLLGFMSLSFTLQYLQVYRSGAKSLLRENLLVVGFFVFVFFLRATHRFSMFA